MVSAMTTRSDILERLETIDDPEMPISIVDLGIVESVEVEERTARIVILPTFVGCPALSMIESSIRDEVMALPAIDDVEVRFVHDPPWSVDRITDHGRARLRDHGVTVPARPRDGTTIPLTTSAVPCPFCGSTSTRLESPFGPARCRTMSYCDACRNTFESVKRV